MRLTKVQVQNFKSIDDSTPFTIANVTSLVGKNEAGKTALLDGLHRLNPVEGGGGYDALLHYPRRRLAEYEERVAAGAQPDTVVTTTWDLETADVAALDASLGEDSLVSPEIRVTRGYGKNTICQVQLDEKRVNVRMDSFLLLAG